jgi:hypothetical protein
VRSSIVMGRILLVEIRAGNAIQTVPGTWDW